MDRHYGLTSEVPPVAHGGGTQPLTIQAVALNIASHREELARIAPDAVSLAAHAVSSFHAAIHGSMTTVLASRNGSYARAQGIGERPLTVEDICEAVTRGGAEGRDAVRALLGPILARLASPAPVMPLEDAAADFAPAAAAVVGAVLRHRDDTEIERDIRAVERTLGELKAAISARQRVVM